LKGQANYRTTEQEFEDEQRKNWVAALRLFQQKVRLFGWVMKTTEQKKIDFISPSIADVCSNWEKRQ